MRCAFPGNRRTHKHGREPCMISNAAFGVFRPGPLAQRPLPPNKLPSVRPSDKYLRLPLVCTCARLFHDKKKSPQHRGLRTKTAHGRHAVATTLGPYTSTSARICGARVCTPSQTTRIAYGLACLVAPTTLHTHAQRRSNSMHAAIKSYTRLQQRCTKLPELELLYSYLPKGRRSEAR